MPKPDRLPTGGLARWLPTGGRTLVCLRVLLLILTVGLAGCTSIEKHPEPATTTRLFNSTVAYGFVCGGISGALRISAWGSGIGGYGVTDAILSGIGAGAGAYIGNLIIARDDTELTEAHRINASRLTCLSYFPDLPGGFFGALLGVTLTSKGKPTSGQAAE